MKHKFSKAIVSIIVLLNVGFAAAVLYVFNKVGAEPTALIAAWFAFTTGELWMLAGIRKEKERKKKRDEHSMGRNSELYQGESGQKDHSNS